MAHHRVDQDVEEDGGEEVPLDDPPPRAEGPPVGDAAAAANRCLGQYAARRRLVLGLNPTVWTGGGGGTWM